MIIGECKRNTKSISKQGHKMIAFFYSYCLLYIGSEILYVAYKGCESAIITEFRARLSTFNCNRINKKLSAQKKY